MAKYGPASAFLLVGGKNLSGDTYTLSESVEQINEETHGLGDSWEETLPVGIARVLLEASGGPYDDRTAGNIEALQGNHGVQQLVSFGMSGYAVGAEVVVLDGALETIFKRIADRGALTKAHAEYAVSSVYRRGKVLHGLTAETTDPGNTEATSVDNGASSASGAYCHLHVPALTLGGFTSVTVKVRHSADNITFADLATFTTVTVAGTAEAVFVAGTINRYLAMSWDFIGAGAAQSVIPYVAVARG